MGRFGTFIMDEAHHSGLYKFLPITLLAVILNRDDKTRGGGHRYILYNILDAMLARTANGPLEFVVTLRDASWLLDERYIRHIVVDKNSRINIVKKTPEWLLMDKQQNIGYTFV